MKKISFLLLLAMVLASVLRAEEVGVEKARAIAASFHNTFSAAKAVPADASLAYTFTNGRGSEGVYVFNFNDGFVMVSADDVYRPIVGYSYEGRFDAKNISPELSYYIGKMIECRDALPRQRVAANTEEWRKLSEGVSISRGGRESFFLLKTLWNQDYPYNYYAPTEDGHRAYAGCVACAMSQVMKYWDSPVRGTGYHEYEYGNFGVLSAYFDTTYYDWENMPNYLYYNSPWEQVNAVATLMYQCGVSVDMMYGVNGSGSFSEWVPDALVNHFSFTEDVELRYRDDYSLEEWQNMLKNEFDHGWPVYYSGSDYDSGHAFVCDGYDDNDMFHFNWGWSGAGDGFFAIDRLNVGGSTFNMDQGAIFNMVPIDVYENTPNPPTNFTAVATGDTDFNATVSWTNPVTLRNGEYMTQIDKIVVLRNGEKVYEANNVAVGIDMSFTDHVGLPIMVKYEIYVEYQLRRSFSQISEAILIGPTCEWRLAMASSSESGWSQGGLVIRNSAYDTICFQTLDAAAAIRTITVPVGNLSFSWLKPKTTSSLDRIIHFDIHDAQNQKVFEYNGTLEDMTDGTFLSLNNGCGQETCRQTVTLALINDGEVRLDWEDTDNEYGYAIYRDGVLYDVVTQNTYTDEGVMAENHYYSVATLCSGGESEHSNIVCNIVGECEAPHNFRYSFVENNKIQFEWDSPEDATGLLGYTIYSRSEGVEYQRLKLLSANANTYKTSYKSWAGHVYEFCIKAMYQDDCESAAALLEGTDGINFFEVNGTILPINLRVVSADEILKLQWSMSTVADSYNVYRDGQLVAENLTEPAYTDNAVEEGNTYCYTVTGVHGTLESGHSNEVCAEFIVSSTDEAENGISLTPNPTTGVIRVSTTNPIDHVVINNAIGQTVCTMQVSNNEANIDLSRYGKGVYIVKIATSDGVVVRKVVVR